MNDKLSDVIAYIAYVMTILIGFLFGILIIMWLLTTIKSFV